MNLTALISGKIQRFSAAITAALAAFLLLLPLISSAQEGNNSNNNSGNVNKQENLDKQENEAATDEAESNSASQENTQTKTEQKSAKNSQEQKDPAAKDSKDNNSSAYKPADNSFSLFFSNKEREAIAQAKASYQERVGRGSEADLLDQLQGIKEGTTEDYLQSKYVAQFYLESLIYHQPADWTVWLKITDVSAKFTPEATTPVLLSVADSSTITDKAGAEKSANESSPATPAAPADALKGGDSAKLAKTLVPAEAPEKITVVKIAKEEAVFEWEPKAWSKVESAFKAGDPRIRLDYSRRKIIFTLTVNQTLTSSDMQIKEGFVPLTPLAPDADKDALLNPNAAVDANALPESVDKILDSAKTEDIKEGNLSEELHGELPAESTANQENKTADNSKENSNDENSAKENSAKDDTVLENYKKLENIKP